MALNPERTGYAVSVGGHVLLVAAGLFAFNATPTPLKLDDSESVPVEIVSEAPAQATRGAREARPQPTPQRVVDRQAPEERETEDPAETRVARERVQNAALPPPPVPRPPTPRPEPEAAETPPPPAAARPPATPPPAAPPQPTPPRQVAAVPPPPAPRPSQPQPQPQRQVAPVEREDLTEKLAELQAQQKREEEQKRREEQRQQAQREAREQAQREAREQAQREAREQAQREAREQAQREAREQAQREAREQAQREAREQAQREAREKAQREAREKAQREARERAERQARADARQFDPNSIAARLSSSTNNDRREATRTEATGAPAPTRTASLGTARGAAPRLTASELDAIREQMQRCWSPPGASAESSSLIAVVDVSFNRDGSISGRPVVSNARSDPAFQAAANAAVRAVLRCAPYRLPAEKYEAWRDVRVRFDPRDVR